MNDNKGVQLKVHPVPVVNSLENCSLQCTLYIPIQTISSVVHWMLVTWPKFHSIPWGSCTEWLGQTQLNCHCVDFDKCSWVADHQPITLLLFKIWIAGECSCNVADVMGNHNSISSYELHNKNHICRYEARLYIIFAFTWESHCSSSLQWKQHKAKEPCRSTHTNI